MVDIKKLAETSISDSSATERMPDGAVMFTLEHTIMIDTVLARKQGHTKFLESLYEWGEEKGWLTKVQNDKLEELYTRLK